jgi:hypothetical protein
MKFSLIENSVDLAGTLVASVVQYSTTTPMSSFQGRLKKIWWIELVWYPCIVAPVVQ